MTGTAGLLLSGAGAGVIAGGTTCATAQLGLLMGAVERDRRTIAPVAAYLTGRSACHAALGAVLGAAGSAVRPGPHLRALFFAGAALLLLRSALGLLGVRIGSPFPRRPEEPAGGPAGRHGLGRAALLGASTVLVPCGLTLSAELLAVASGSPAGGAAVMTGFVAGTAPFTGVLGVALSRGLPALRRRGLPATVAGVLLIAVAGWTLLSGLRLGGWLPAGASAAAAAEQRFVRMGADGTQVITIWALERGYRPARVTARAGVRTVLVVRTTGTAGCTRAFVIPSRDLERVLPPNGEARIDLRSPPVGRLRFVCASGHYPGEIGFQP